MIASICLVVALGTMSSADIVSAPDTVSTPATITLEQALQIALSENVSVKVADKEIERAEYARRGSYASLFPQIDANGAYQRTLKKQVMYMDFDMSSLGGLPGMGGSEGTDPNDPLAGLGGGAGAGAGADAPSSNDGFEVGRWNTFTAGVSASMPLVNAQLWKSLKISGQDVELAVEKARSSRLEMVTQVKQAFFGVLLAKEAFNVYKSVYDNAKENLEQTQKKYNAQRASELELTRAKATLANSIPNVYDSESAIITALWQLKAVMGVDLDENIDVAGSLGDYSVDLMNGPEYNAGELTLSNNSTLRQLSIQAEELANMVKMQQYAYLPSLALAFSYSFNAMTNDFNFSQYKWTPYSYVGLSLAIPIFSGGKRLNSVRQARVQASELSLQAQNTERQLKIAIRQYLNTMETAMKSYDAARGALETAEKAYNIASKSYSVGRSTLIELNDAQLALTQARLGADQAIYSFQVAKSNLEQVLGNDFLE